MDKSNLISKCGVFCGACSIYHASHGNEALMNQLSKVFNLPPEKIKCNGCGAITEDSWCFGCKFIKCTEEKAVDLCENCSEFPCQIAIEFHNDKYTHHRLVLNDISRRKEIGNEKWIEEQIKRWSCTKCGRPYTWYEKVCANCGSELDSCIKEH